MSSDPLEQMVEAEERDAITGAISRLPERERLVFRMCAVEGFTASETASCLAMNQRSVRTALNAANRLLRAAVARS